MTLLLDTHVLLWFLFGDPRLSLATKASIEAPEAAVVVSLVSFWEIALKIRIGKLSIDLESVFDDVRGAGFTILALKEGHIRTLRQLPLIPGHRDPFDHLLIAQAVAEDATFLSNDAWVAHYPVRHQATA